MGAQASSSSSSAPSTGTELNWWNLYYFSDDLADFFPQNSLPVHTLSPYCLVGSPTRQNARQYLPVWKYCRIIVY